MKYLLLAFAFVPAIATAQISDGFDENISEQVERNIEEANERPPQDVLGKMVERNIAELFFLDRLNGKVEKFTLTVGATTQKEHLGIELDACLSPQDATNDDAAAYLRIIDDRQSEPSFDGWMIASSPALSALEHRRYDVWVSRCLREEPSDG